MVVGSHRDDVIEGVYELSYFSATNQYVISGLASCQGYFVAVRMVAPSLGPLSTIQQASTKKGISRSYFSMIASYFANQYPIIFSIDVKYSVRIILYNDK